MARYWPEFAAGGKEHVEVRHLMAHTAGLPGWDEPMRPEDLADWDEVHLAAGRPGAVVGAGHRVGLPRLTQGYLIGEVVRRITGDDHRDLVRLARWPARWAPTSTSACPSRRTTGCRW